MCLLASAIDRNLDVYMANLRIFRICTIRGLPMTCTVLEIDIYRTNYSKNNALYGSQRCELLKSSLLKKLGF